MGDSIENVDLLDTQAPQGAPPKTKKVKTTITVNGMEKEVEIEVPDIEASWGKKAERKNVGSRVTRLDGLEKVTGRAKYSYDINLPGMLHGRLLGSPVAKARITEVDLEPAKMIPGVKAVIALKQNGATVRYHGDPIAALAAVSPEVAEDAIRAIVVKYDFEQFVVRPEDAAKPGAPLVFSGQPARPDAPPRPNVEPGNTSERGDVAAGFANAKAIVEGEYYATPRVHCCLETHGHVVAPQADGTLTVWSSTQAVHGTADEFARISQLSRDKVHVITQHMGGGFGSKFGAGPEGAAAFQLAKAAGAPVKMLLDRKMEALSAGHAPSAKMKVKLGAATDGALTAIEAEGWGSGGLGGAGFPYPYIYTVGAQKVKRDTVRTNVQPSNSMRAPGHPQASFLMEGIVDEVAYKLGMDPLELRIKNDTQTGGWKQRQEEYKIGAEKIGWKQNFNKTPGKGGPKVRGVGVASATWGGGGGNPNVKALITIGTDGSIVVRHGTQDLGTGVRSFIPLIVADELGVPREWISVEIGDSKLPNSVGSGGSTTTPAVAPAIKMTAIQAKFDLLKAIAEKTGEPIEKLQILPGGKISNGTKTLDWKEACKRLPPGGITSQGAWTDTLIQPGVGGVQFAHVEVDMETGRVRPLKVVAVQDCGIVMNRLTVESQVNGGIIQGLGFALTEDQIYDWQTGRMVNPNLEEYKLPGPWEMPEIEVVMYEPEDAKGVAGMAEPAVIPTAAAIANAVYNACGARVRSLPITPKHVLEALGKVPGTGRG
jgi:xanthine dehydrogenase YagR molybdenum-binding subunit